MKMELNMFKTLVAAVAALAISGCGMLGQGSLQGLSAVIEGATDESGQTITTIFENKKQLKNKVSAFRRELGLKIYCDATATDVFSMPAFDRELWKYICGWSDSIPTVMMGFPVPQPEPGVTGQPAQVAPLVREAAPPSQ